MYPAKEYIIGFTQGNMRQGETLENAKKRLIKDAQGQIAEGIRVQVESKTTSRDISTRVNQTEQLNSSFDASVKTASNAEVVGIKTESYYDKDEDVIYAFAYANKYELAGYYKANIGMLLQQAEGSLTTAEQLEQSGEKSKARKQCEDAMPIFAKVRYAQDLLTALDAADSESLQQAKSEGLRNEATQMMARLAQGLYVYLESSENLFGKKVNILDNKLKAILAKNGCSFTNDAAQADLKLTLSTTTREISNNAGSMVFCYADTQVDVYDNHKGKSVYNDEISQKGGGVSQERAGRKALEDAAPKLAEKIMPWIKN
ncbi:hypothetical protein AGMMS4956_12680 [Bacteroidia bacterium]|nr:hypothetical protein AGMMS4956_12680 [Bacteroidia bacterium]